MIEENFGETFAWTGQKLLFSGGFQLLFGFSGATSNKNIQFMNNNYY